MTVDAVVFDLGNVLVRWDPYLPFVGRMDRAEVEAMFDEIDFPTINHGLDAGRPWAEARAEVFRRYPHRVDAFDFYREHFADSIPGPVDGSARLVRDLVGAGIRTLGLTNWSAETFHHAEPAAPAIGLLEDVLVSGEVGVAKPDRRIFRLLANRFQLDPGRTVFTDDSAPNVAAAAAEGYVAVLFTDADDLRTDLVRRGLPIPAA
ncbi:MAG TPA: HAD family phosphatase [Cellulomonas sp.]|uniref:HAD family hydrolase n=1 Tax=Cellulomonas sp. TaxID=40001 RepID=UPI002E363D44|nr:HAD family phosphatase [Cellulomonas sp.]HEX5332740.1 HAD family phosphatase [Cellulomonas sp.]